MQFTLSNMRFLHLFIYGDVIFDQEYNKSFHESLESLQ